MSPDVLSLSSLEMKQINGFLDKLDSIGKVCTHSAYTVSLVKVTYLML